MGASPLCVVVLCWCGCSCGGDCSGSSGLVLGVYEAVSVSGVTPSFVHVDCLVLTRWPQMLRNNFVVIYI